MASKEEKIIADEGVIAHEVEEKEEQEPSFLEI